MALKSADDGVPFGRFDRWALWLLPGYLAAVGSSVGHSVVLRALLAGIGAGAGFAVVRGIRAALADRGDAK